MPLNKTNHQLLEEGYIKIPLWQLVQIEDTLRLAARTLNNKQKVTSIDRDIMQAWQFAKNAIAGESDKHVSRL